MSEHLGSCHCGAIRLTLRDTPREAATCNCSLCRRIGGLWHYCERDLATVQGEGNTYRQGDCFLDNWHCRTCGCATHWTAVNPDHARMAVNLRMFEPALWDALPRRYIDGASY